MSWQDELRRLDEELATGRISADDYRTRRDQVMSAAVSPGTDPKPPTAGESTTIMPPVQQQPQGGNADADKTQIVSGQSMEAPDRTQVVGGGWQTARPGGPEDGERTQYVPGVPPQNTAGGRDPRHPQGFPPGPGGFPPPGNEPPWQQQEDLSPPWGGQDFLPLAAANNPDWSRQGPEVFDEGRSSGPWKVLGIIGIVVVLLGIAAGAYFMFRPDDTQAKEDPGGNPGGNSSETNEAPPPEEPKGPVAELPGEVTDMSPIDTFEKVKGIDYLTPQEIVIYDTAGATKSTVGIAMENGVRIIVLVTEQADEASTITARDELGALQLRFDLTEREAPAGVQAAANDQASRGPLLRAHYASGTNLVRLQVQGEDAAETNRLFEEILEAQLERLPADG